MSAEKPFHPAANLFPLMEGSEFAELVDDIRYHGLHEPVVLYDGQILDGRNRYRACLEAGVEPRFDEYAGSDPIAYVVSLNLKRRHLSESQRAMVAARIADMQQGARTDLSPIGAKSQGEVADLMGVSRRSVQRAKQVIDSDDADLTAAVEHGEIKVSAAADYTKHQYEGYDRRKASVEYYTQAKHIDLARRVLGAIDLDPASCAEANETVCATRIYTREDDGLEWSWHGRVWMNPPYGDHGPKFISKLIEEYEGGRVDTAIVLLNTHCVTARYFTPLWDYILCFTRGRIGFHKPGGELVNANLSGSVFIYLGPDRDRFAEVFGDIGYVVHRYDKEAS